MGAGGHTKMPRMLGDKALPEAVQIRRRKLRERVQALRQPVRDFRRNNVPGPNVVDKAESSLMDLRDRFVTREGVVARLRQRSGGNDDSDTSDSNGGQTSSSQSSGAELMT